VEAVAWERVEVRVRGVQAGGKAIAVCKETCMIELTSRAYEGVIVFLLGFALLEAFVITRLIRLYNDSARKLQELTTHEYFKRRPL